jgi:hypothetical protein
MGFTKSKFAIRKKEYLLSEEVARDQVMSFLEFYDIDVEKIEDKKQYDGMISIFNKLVEFIRAGLIEFKKENGSIKIIQYIGGQGTKTSTGEIEMITYGEISGKNKVECDGYGEKDTYSRMYALMGSLSGLGEAGIKLLKGLDLSVVECLSALYLNI